MEVVQKLLVTAYAVYLPVTILLTLYVAHVLFKNGRIFMVDIFKGKMDIANATNTLFKVGFYLMNIGFAMLVLKIHQPWHNLETLVDGEFVLNPALIDTTTEVMEVLAYKVGGFAIYLGVMLFLNLYLFFRGRRKARQKMVPPIPPLAVETA